MNLGFNPRLYTMPFAEVKLIRCIGMIMATSCVCKPVKHYDVVPTLTFVCLQMILFPHIVQDFWGKITYVWVIL